MGWHEVRFTQDASKVEVACEVCTRPMWLPKSKAGKYLTCSHECSEVRRRKMLDARRRNCETCGVPFVPRKAQLASGGGRYCSQRCNTAAHRAMNTPDAQKKSKATFREKLSAGLYMPVTGSAHPSWKGGKEHRKQWLARRIESGVEARQLRERRTKNPDQYKEYTRSRRGQLTGRLPRGTIKKIGSLQNWKCAICRCSVRDNYHVDHILPLKLGGAHMPKNIQLLCAPCNLRKSAKHPVAFMQERGFLL